MYNYDKLLNYIHMYNYSNKLKIYTITISYLTIYIEGANFCLNSSTQSVSIISSSNLFHSGTILGRKEYLYTSIIGW